MDETHARWGAAAASTAISPSYTNPPVVETSLLVQFAPQQDWTIDVFGAFAAATKDRFPRFEALGPIVLRSAMPFSFTMAPAPKIRGLYLNDEQGRVIQIQDDFFAINWRKPAPDASYPRYAALRREFEDELQRYVEFFEQRGQARPVVIGCQVTYINILDPGLGLGYNDVWNRMRRDADRRSSDELTMTSLVINSRLSSGSVDLTYNVAPVLRIQDNATVVQFTIVSYEASVHNDGADLLPRMDGAHNALITAFETMTSDDAKLAWGKQ